MLTTLINKISNPDSLKARSIKGSFYLTCGTVMDRGLAFIRNMILTRILFPEEMGIMVILLSIIGLFEVLTDIGIKISVIQNPKGAEPLFLNMTWWFQVVRGAGLYIVGFLLTPLIFWFFFSSKTDVLILHSEKELIAMIRIVFLTILLNSLISPASFVLEKELKFAKVVLLNQGTAIIGTLLTIGLCFYYKSVWAMIWSNTIIAGFRSLLSFIVCPFIPRFSVQWDSMNELFDFSRRMFGLSFLTYLSFNLDILVLGRLVSAKEVGLYGMAASLAFIPRDLFSKIISPVILPVFSKKQSNNIALSKYTIQISKYISLIGFPLFPICFFYGDSFLKYIYGNSYSSAGTVFGIFYLSSIVYILAIITTTVLFAKNMPEKHRSFNLLRTLLISIMIYPAINIGGLEGASFAVFISIFSAHIYQLYILKKNIGLNIYEYWQRNRYGIITGLILLGFLSLIQYLRIQVFP